MNDDNVIRCDLEGYARAYIEEVLGTFIEGASAHGRRVSDIRMRRAMFERLEIERQGQEAHFMGVPVTIADTGFDGTIEVQFVPLSH